MAEHIVRCVTCGFLSREDQQNVYGEVTPDVRQRAVDMRDTAMQGGIFRPACFQYALNLPAEAERLMQGEPHVAPAYTVVNAAGLGRAIDLARECGKWMEYTPGLSPKEHLERLHTLEVERSRQEHELRIAEMERQARASSEQVQADSLAISKALKEGAEATSRFTTKWTYIAAGLATVAVIATIVGAIFAALSYFHSVPAALGPTP